MSLFTKSKKDKSKKAKAFSRISSEEKELKKNISLLDSVINSTVSGLLVVDCKGKVELFNEQFKKIWGIPDRLIKKGNDKELLKFVLSQLIDPKGFLKKVNYLYKHTEEESHDIIYFKDGKIIDRYSRPQKIENKILGRVWSFTDVTEEKNLDRAKDEFIFLTAHQLRTPLSASKWTLELLRKEDNVSGFLRKKIATLFDNNEKLISLVNNLLNVSRISAGKIQPNKKKLDIQKLVEESVKNARNVSSTKKNIRISIGKGVKKAKVDPLFFSIALNNILLNEIDYSFPGADISISAKKVNNNYLISVHNDGPIISIVDQRNLFKKFFRGENAKKIKAEGTGLGLFIAKGLIEANGGNIGIVSKRGFGTTFHFTVPIN